MEASRLVGCVLLVLFLELAISCRYDSAVSFVWKSQSMGSCSLAIFCPATRTQSPIILLFIILRTSVQVGKNITLPGFTSGTGIHWVFCVPSFYIISLHLVV